MSDRADLAPLAGLCPQAPRWKRSLGCRQMANISLGTKYELSISKSEVFWGRVRVVSKKVILKLSQGWDSYRRGGFKKITFQKEETGSKEREEGKCGAKCDGKAEVQNMSGDICEGVLESLVRPNPWAL